MKDDINEIAQVYHNWRTEDDSYEDIKGFCKSSTIEEVRKLDYVLTPGRYVGLADEEDDFDFEERIKALKTEFEKQLDEEDKLNKKILESLAKIHVQGQVGEKTYDND